MLAHLQSALGIGVILFAAWVMSEDRRAFPWRTVVIGLAVQIALALLLLKIPVRAIRVAALNGVVDALMAATQAGTSFVFGYVGGGATAVRGDESPERSDELRVPGAAAGPRDVGAVGAAVALARAAGDRRRRLPVSLQKIVAASAARWDWAPRATIFLGMIEAPLLIRPYLAKLTRAELFMLFTVGFATVAGTVMVLYATDAASRRAGRARSHSRCLVDVAAGRRSSSRG